MINLFPHHTGVQEDPVRVSTTSSTRMSQECVSHHDQVLVSVNVGHFDKDAYEILTAIIMLFNCITNT